MLYIYIVSRERPGCTPYPEAYGAGHPRLTRTAMFTALQLSQLAAAAWSGPAAAHFATISHYQAPDGYARTQYSVSYHVGTVCHLAQAPCPFEAVAAAVRTFAAAQPHPSLTAALVVAHATRVLRKAAAAFAGAPLPRPGFAARARRRRPVVSGMRRA